MKEKKSVNVYNLIILDESGSMSSIYDATLSAINETLAQIRKNQQNYPEQHHYVSIITFEGDGMAGVKTRRDRVAIEKLEDFTADDYRPGGCTPLYDAMGYGITSLEKNISSDDVVMATIITDGYENSSHEYSGKDIKAIVSQRREKGWTFAYIGANQEAIEVARDLSIPNALNFDATDDGVVLMGRCMARSFGCFCAELDRSCSESDAPMSFDSLFDNEAK